MQQSKLSHKSEIRLVTLCLFFSHYMEIIKPYLEIIVENEFWESQVSVSALYHHHSVRKGVLRNFVKSRGFIIKKLS